MKSEALQKITKLPTPFLLAGVNINRQRKLAFQMLFIIFFTHIACAKEVELDLPDGDRIVEFGQKEYSIPADYLPGITAWNKNTGYAAFSINVLLPDFTPAGKDLDEFNRTGWHNQLRALFEHGRQFKSPRQSIDEYLSWGHVDSKDFEKQANGCALYRGDMTVTHELYACYQTHNLFYFTCDTSIEVPSPSCRIIENIDSETTVIYDYSKKYLDSAVNIDDHLRKLAEALSRTR